MRRTLILFLVALIVGSLFSEVAVLQECGMTRQEARDMLMRAALEQVNGAFIRSKTKVEDFQTVADVVYSRVKGFVKISEILKEWEEDDGFGNTLYCVRAKVEVMREKVEERISELMEEVGNPTVAVITVENYTNRSYSSRCDIGETFGFFEKFGFKGFLKENGLEVQELSPGVVEKIEREVKNRGFSSQVVDEIAEDARDIASYVVVVKADYYGTYESDYDVCSVKAEALAKIIRTDTRKTMDLSYSEVIAKYQPMNAVEWILKNSRSDANLERIAHDVAQEIYIDRVNYAFNPKNVRVRFILPSVEMASAIEDLMEGLPEIMNVSKQFSKGKELLLAVQTYRTPEKLWDLMKENLKDNIEMELVDLRGDTIVVRVLNVFSESSKTISLKFQLDSIATGARVKRCLESLEILRIEGLKKDRSRKIYIFEVVTNEDPEDLMIEIEDMECEKVEITAEDIADDGSWILFSAERR